MPSVPLRLPSPPFAIWGTRVCRQKQLQSTDKRIGLVGDALQGVRVIKAYGWEANFRKLIHGMRGTEYYQPPQPTPF